MCKKSLNSVTNKQRQNVTAINSISSLDNACLPFANEKYVKTLITVIIPLSCHLQSLSTVPTFIDRVNSQYLRAVMCEGEFSERVLCGV